MGKTNDKADYIVTFFFKCSLLSKEKEKENKDKLSLCMETPQKKEASAHLHHSKDNKGKTPF